MRTVAEAGLNHFDVASLGEIELVHRAAPGARMSFMHPVKSRTAIRRAYFEFGIRDFSLDSEAELVKILEETGYAKDLNLFVRVSVSNRHSNYSLAGKFGITGKGAADLMFKARQHVEKLGICFHAGSQLMNPEAFRVAMQEVSQLVSKSGVIVDILDVGGGFPSIYPGLVPPPLEKYIQVISESFEQTLVLETCELWCEPGRALVAEGASLVVKVELRKGNRLYLNDGTYGGLFDAGQPAMVYPARRVEAKASNRPLEDFSFFGPTCDSIDYMQGPFRLPADIDEGDYIEIDNLGAYSMSLRSGFNGFDHCERVVVENAPALSMYGLAKGEMPAPTVIRKSKSSKVKVKTSKTGKRVESLLEGDIHDAG